jgi:hypothetical protein
VLGAAVGSIGAPLGATISAVVAALGIDHNLDGGGPASQRPRGTDDTPNAVDCRGASHPRSRTTAPAPGVDDDHIVDPAVGPVVDAAVGPVEFERALLCRGVGSAVDAALSALLSALRASTSVRALKRVGLLGALLGTAIGAAAAASLGSPIAATVGSRPLGGQRIAKMTRGRRCLLARCCGQRLAGLGPRMSCASRDAVSSSRPGSTWL